MICAFVIMFTLTFLRFVTLCVVYKYIITRSALFVNTFLKKSLIFFTKKITPRPKAERRKEKEIYEKTYFSALFIAV
jgi:hypothetical protein